ncbi:hypothetical protein F2Q70_00003032 [Brassica cretica]|uniref:Uncharacterized protein n=1 Tax=Brassica cretica TaxID=69181 RepID=A0A8S9IXU6_BRACR|nr:hypothetical protein F2Q70_00003032 [Brassica cretica]
MSCSTRSNKEKSLLFSDLALLERTIRKGKRSTSIDNNINLSTETSQQTSTDTPNLLTNSCELPPIDTSIRTSINVRSRYMDATLILDRRSTERINRRSTVTFWHRSTSTSLITSATTQNRCSTIECTQKPISTFKDINKQYSEQSEDAPEPMQVDQAIAGRTLRKRKEKVPKHLKRGANDKEMDSFTKRILRIPMDKPFEEAYFTHVFFAVHTAIPSKRKMSAMETDEYDEDYKEEATIEYRGLAMEES